MTAVTETVVNLALGAFERTLNGNNQHVNVRIDAMRAALTAALAALTQGGVKVKELEWEPYPNPRFASDDVAIAIIKEFGVHKYQVQLDPWLPDYVAYLTPEFGTRFWVSNGHPTLEAAKSAAQADYETRIMSALEYPKSTILSDFMEQSGWRSALTPLQPVGDWHDGAPANPWDKEWFIAVTTYGDRVVLKALPEEFTYDFKTADETYIMRDKIKKWMQFPDSQYIAPEASALSTKLQEPVGYMAKHDYDRFTDPSLGFRVDTWRVQQRKSDVALYTASPTLAHQPGTAGWDEAIDEAAKVARQYGDTKKQGQWDAAYQIADLIAALKSEGRNDE